VKPAKEVVADNALAVVKRTPEEATFEEQLVEKKPVAEEATLEDQPAEEKLDPADATFEDKLVEKKPAPEEATLEDKLVEKKPVAEEVALEVVPLAVVPIDKKADPPSLKLSAEGEITIAMATESSTMENLRPDFRSEFLKAQGGAAVCSKCRWSYGRLRRNEEKANRIGFAVSWATTTPRRSPKISEACSRFSLRCHLL
jgi:hypothetical protein